MCECYCPCYYEPPAKKWRKLSVLLLECWQREYDQRPYYNFKFDRMDMESRLERSFSFLKDFPIIVDFLLKKPLISCQIVGIQAVTALENFTLALLNIRYIKLNLLYVPNTFFKLLENNVHKMRITNLSLEGTQLTDNDIVCLQSILIQSTTLQYLNVAFCSVTQYNFVHLADGIHKSKSMRGFNCSRILGVYVSLDTAKIIHTLSSLIWQNKLTEIVMQHCEFLAQDIEIITEYMYSKESVLRRLDLSNNKIGANGMRYLLKAISASGNLTHLYVSGCGLGIHGGEFVSKYLSSCANLIYLDIRYNEINAEAINQILLTMKKPIKLNKLLIYGNKFNPQTGAILHRLFDARVLPQDYIDVTITFDDTIPGYRVIPWST